MSADPVVTARTMVELARDERFADVVASFAPALRAVVSVETLQVAWLAETSARGPVSAIGEPVSDPLSVSARTPAGTGLVRITVPVTCARGAFTVVMSIDGAGALHGLRLAPAAVAPWAPPPYTARRRFRERDVTVESGPAAVPGTLSLPRGRGPRPGVVLLSGGGPFDRDGTAGPNKPLKDLALGLASRGVAVVRFDKVTHAHGGPHPNARGFTVTDEYAPHALAAFHLLRRHPAVDSDRVFVLGHSLGGKVAPRVAAAEPSIAGLIIMAGEAEPMHRSAVRVARHLATLNPGPSADAAIAAITRQAALVDDPDLTPRTPSADLPFGLPASYWLDLREYDPVATAAALHRPMLILQGGRDYQVTVADDLTRWRAALADRADVTIRVHEADDHLFFPGSGPSTPAAYARPQHVDPAVVADIAEWLIPHRGQAARFLPMARRLALPRIVRSCL